MPLIMTAAMAPEAPSDAYVGFRLKRSVVGMNPTTAADR